MNNLYLFSGVGALGVAGGGAYLIHNVISNASESTLRSRLEKERYSIMESANSHWATVLGKYNDSSIAIGKKFSDLVGTVTEQSLKQKCESILSSNDSDLYEKAKLWCAVPRTVQERLKDLGISVLKMTGDNEDGDKTSWNKLKDKYKEAAKNEKIKDFTITSDPEAENSWQLLRTECGKHIVKDKWDVDYDYYLDKVTTWCSSASKLLNE